MKLFTSDIFEIMSNFIGYEEVSLKSIYIFKTLFGFNAEIQNLFDRKSFLLMLMVLRGPPNNNLKVSILDSIMFFMENLIQKIIPEFVD